MMKRVAVLVGSLRKDSLNLKLANAVNSIAEPKWTGDLVTLADLPVYDDDLWQPVLAFKQAIAEADGVIFVSPEYNRSIPAVLKNAIDWGSRPKGENSWQGKPGAVIGASPGAIGAAVAQSHLRYIAGVVGIALLAQPEVYFSSNQHPLAADGSFIKPETSAFIDDFVTKFATWMDLIAGVEK
jgi:chromate reductase